MRGIKYELTNLNTPLRDFSKHFSLTQPNVIILNSAAYKPLERIFEKMDSLKRLEPSLIISTFGYNEWFIYQPNLERDYFKYNVHIPTTYYFSRTSDRVESFERDYKRRYGQNMNPDCLPKEWLFWAMMKRCSSSVEYPNTARRLLAARNRI